MAKLSPLMLAPPLVFAALAGLFVFGMARDNPDELPAARAGKSAPVLALTPLGDGPQAIDAMLRTGEVKLVNFWASWCAPCRAEHAQLEALAAQGIDIIGINYKDDPDKALAFLDELGNPYAALGADPEARNALEWGLYGVPETYVVDAEGTVTFRFAGPITASILQSTILPKIDDAR
ncbi:DsbE family thiol:disulfide interchange protein [Aliiroseovarius sp. PTFE2010]|uniref:DsbE family thiol:disulfide interchange protein n=1 Tax=Aliiroseovarius sp. PTFE2010 TaxID=3417190 RepID=UPI003CF27F9F